MKDRIGMFMLLGLSFLMLTLAGCSSTNSSVVYGSESEELILVEQFEAVRQVMDNFFSCGRIVSIRAEDLHEIIEEQNEDYYLVDIRANQDFTKNNIAGSVSIPYAETLDVKKLETLPKDKTIVIIDYNGHQAAQTAATWKQLGYKTMPLYYGIQSWTNELAAINYDVFPSKPLEFPLVTEEEISVAEHKLPEILYPEDETEAYIAQTVNTYLDRNYKGIITAEELQASLSSDGEKQYMLIDIREPKHYKMGHVEGAINIPLHKLAEMKSLKSYPQDKRIVLIGYDGLDGSQAARALVTLSYDAVALKYGMSYWSSNETVTGIIPINNQVKVREDYLLLPLNYLAPTTAVAGCA